MTARANGGTPAPALVAPQCEPTGPTETALSHEVALAELLAHSGHQFDPHIVTAFLNVIEDNSSHDTVRSTAAAASSQNKRTNDGSPPSSYDGVFSETRDELDDAA